jgi:hypothetical protein
MKLYIYVYEVIKIKKTFGDMYGAIENFVTNILSNKINTQVQNSNVEKSLYYIQLIMVTIWVFIVYLILFWRKNMYRFLSWASIKTGYTKPDDNGEPQSRYQFLKSIFFTDSGEKTSWKSSFESLKTLAPILGKILEVIAFIFAVDWFICMIIYYIYINIRNSSNNVMYFRVRWENFVTGFLWYIKEIQSAIGKLFELMFRKLMADIANSNIIAQARENIKSNIQDFSANDQSDNDQSDNDQSDNDQND